MVVRIFTLTVVKVDDGKCNLHYMHLSAFTEALHLWKRQEKKFPFVTGGGMLSSSEKSWGDH